MIREILAKEGAGESKRYSHGSFSAKGISRYMPKQSADPSQEKSGN